MESLLNSTNIVLCITLLYYSTEAMVYEIMNKITENYAGEVTVGEAVPYYSLLPKFEKEFVIYQFTSIKARKIIK